MGGKKEVKKREPLSSPYRLRLPMSVLSKYENLAKNTGSNVSEVLRTALTDKADKITIRSQDPRVKKHQARIIRMMANAGNNLNQIARHLNTLHLRGELTFYTVKSSLLTLENIQEELNNLNRYYSNDN